MKTSRIHRLVEAIPQRVHIFTGAHGVHTLQRAWDCPEIHRLARALYDPAFPWAYASAFADAKLPLPALVHEPAIREAHGYLTTGRCSDDLRGALVLRAEPLKLKRGLLEALLLIAPAIALERIGEFTCESVGTIKIYEALFFSVRDRANDLCYRANIAYPETRQVEFQKDYLAKVDPCDLLKRAALGGDVDAVMELMGVLPSGRQLSDQEYTRIVKTKILSEAAWLAEAGLIHQPLRVFDLAVKLINASERAAARAQAAATRVPTLSVATAAPAPGWSLLQSVKATLANDQAKARSAKTKLATSLITRSRSSQSSRSSRSSWSSREGQPPISCPKRQTTLWVGSSNRMRTADTELFPQGARDALQENLLGTTDRSTRLTEELVITE